MERQEINTKSLIDFIPYERYWEYWSSLMWKPILMSAPSLMPM
jgi:hypothetical protein